MTADAGSQDASTDPDYTTDTARHPFRPSDGDSCICGVCGEHENWHKERTMTDAEKIAERLEQEIIAKCCGHEKRIRDTLLDLGLREAVKALNVYANGNRTAVLQAGTAGMATIALARLSGDTAESVTEDAALSALKGEKA